MTQPSTPCRVVVEQTEAAPGDEGVVLVKAKPHKVDQQVVQPTRLNAGIVGKSDIFQENVEAILPQPTKECELLVNKAMEAREPGELAEVVVAAEEAVGVVVVAGEVAGIMEAKEAAVFEQ